MCGYGVSSIQVWKWTVQSFFKWDLTKIVCVYNEYMRFGIKILANVKCI